MSTESSVRHEESRTSYQHIEIATCQDLDKADKLAAFRERFRLPENLIYLDGNSLGPLPKATPARIAEGLKYHQIPDKLDAQNASLQVVEQEWGVDLISSWNKHGWFTMASRVGAKIARIIGAKAYEVMVADSTSVNLFKVVSAALHLRPERRAIISEKANFPTDLYVLEGLIRQLGNCHELRLVGNDADISDSITDDVAVVVLTHVSYRTGRMLNMARYTQLAHKAGALVVWDLAHSAGAVPVDLNAVGADFAVGCGYKFLNGGPGAPAFLFVAKELQESCAQPLSGWFGHVRPFAFEHAYAPGGGILRFQCGTPPVLSLVALEVGVDLILEASQEDLRRKSIKLCETFLTLVQQECSSWAFRLVSPSRGDERGSQICLAHPEGYAVIQALIAQGAVGDFRAPDILRFGFAPLYNSYLDVWTAVQKLKIVMRDRLWDRKEYRQRSAVT